MKRFNREVSELMSEAKMYTYNFHLSVEDTATQQIVADLTSLLTKLQAAEKRRPPNCEPTHLARLHRTIERCVDIVDGRVQPDPQIASLMTTKGKVPGEPSKPSLRRPKAQKGRVEPLQENTKTLEQLMPSTRTMTLRSQVLPSQQQKLSKQKRRAIFDAKKTTAIASQPVQPSQNNLIPPRESKVNTTSPQSFTKSGHGNDAPFVHPDRLRLADWSIEQPKLDKHDLMIDTSAKVQPSAASDEEMIDSGIDIPSEEDPALMSGPLRYTIDTTGDPSLMRNVQTAHYQWDEGAGSEMTGNEISSESVQGIEPATNIRDDGEKLAQRDSAANLDLLQSEIDKQLYAAGLDVRDNDIWYDAEENLDFDMLP